jgi:hypothetical protein
VIQVTIDVPTEDGDEQVWSGCWPQLPVKGWTFELRPRAGEVSGYYRVESVHLVMFTGEDGSPPQVASATITASPLAEEQS